MKPKQFASFSYLVLISVLCLASRAQAQPELPFTEWTGGAGNWHDPGKWTAGVPDGDEFAQVANGEVSFDSDARPHALVIGPSGPVNEIATITGTADLIVNAILEVGTAGGTGTGTVERGTGKLTLTGDLRVLGATIFPDDPFDMVAADISIGRASGTGTNTSFTGVGEVNVTDGDVSVPLGIGVGSGGGTGTRTTMVGRGTMNVTGGDVTTQNLIIGLSSGTGTATGTGVGEMTVTSGDVVLVDSPLDAEYDPDIPGSLHTRLWIGIAGGTGGFNGNATGTLKVFHGDIVAESVMIGRTSPISSSSGASQGSLFLEDGDLQMKEMVLGLSSNNGGPASGVFEQIRGTTTGDSLFLGPTSKMILGISGAVPGADYSQVLVDDVLLDGTFEARFIDGYLPAPGDVIDLVVANSIAGNYDFEITGINAADYPNLVVTRNNHLIRLTFLVPEPGSLVALSLSLLLMLGSNRRTR